MSSSETVVRQLRLTSIWTEVFPSVLEKTLPDDVPLGKLARQNRYAEPFLEALRGGGEFTTPWRVIANQGENFFWKYYLDMGAFSLAQASAAKAWMRLVPLRDSFEGQVELSLPSMEGRVTLEKFYYSHGIALLAHVTITTPQPLFQAVHAAVKTRRDKVYEIAWHDGRTAKMNLDAMCIQILNEVSLRALAGRNWVGQRPSTPFTVATVIDADLPDGFDLTKTLDDHHPVHRALDGLCALNADFEHRALGPLAEATLDIRQAPASHLLYARRRARSVWCPSHFKAAKPKRSLGCYHRNLVCASMQTEIVMELLKMAAKSLRENRSIPSSMRRLIKSAGGLAGRLFAGTSDIYRSDSVRRQLLDSGSDTLDDINLVRALLDCGSKIP